MSTSIEQLMNSNQGNGASMNEVDAIEIDVINFLKSSLAKI